MNDLNPFLLDAVPFLKFYATLLGVAAIVAWVAGRKFRKRTDWNEENLKKLAASLTPEEVGYLAKGPRGAIDTALFELSQLKKIKVLDNNKLKARGGRDPNHSILKQGIVLSAKKPTNLLSTRKACGNAVKRIGDSMRQEGLIETVASFLPSRIATGIVMAVPLTVGLIRAWNGIHKGRPVGYLAALLLLTAFIAGVLMLKPRLTLGGKRLLKYFRRNTLRPNYQVFERRMPGKEQREASAPASSAVPAEWLAALPISVAVFGIRAADHRFCISGLQNLINSDHSHSVSDTIWMGGEADGCGGDGGCGGGCGGCGG